MPRHKLIIITILAVLLNFGCSTLPPKEGHNLFRIARNVTQFKQQFETRKNQDRIVFLDIRREDKYAGDAHSKIKQMQLLGENIGKRGLVLVLSELTYLDDRETNLSPLDIFDSIVNSNVSPVPITYSESPLLVLFGRRKKLTEPDYIISLASMSERCTTYFVNEITQAVRKGGIEEYTSLDTNTIKDFTCNAVDEIENVLPINIGRIIITIKNILRQMTL